MKYFKYLATITFMKLLGFFLNIIMIVSYMKEKYLEVVLANSHIFFVL